MKKVLFIIAVSFIGCNQKSGTLNYNNHSSELNKLAPTPPMGWNSWDCFGVTVNEDQVKANAIYMAEKLKSFGWEYIVVDLGWYLPPEINTATFKMMHPPQSIDEYGRLIPDMVKFPSASGGQGFKPLADYIHSLGLKFGIHIMRGIPWQAVVSKSPVYGTSLKADQVCNPDDSCSWYNGMKGVDMSKPGSQEYYNSILSLYAGWGVDFIKADDMSSPYHAGEIEGLSKAISHSGRPVILSLSPGAAPLERADHLNKFANMWRISGDFWDYWPLLKKQFDLCRQWQYNIRPNHWPDADMLPKIHNRYFVTEILHHPQVMAYEKKRDI